MLNIQIKTIKESPNYNELNKAGENWKVATLKTAIVTKEGTKAGNPTVDLQFEDEHGNKFIAMVKGSLLEGLGKVISANMKLDIANDTRIQ